MTTPTPEAQASQGTTTRGRGALRSLPFRRRSCHLQEIARLGALRVFRQLTSPVSWPPSCAASASTSPSGCPPDSRSGWFPSPAPVAAVGGGGRRAGDPLGRRAGAGARSRSRSPGPVVSGTHRRSGVASPTGGGGAVVVGSVGVLVRAYRSGLLRREELDAAVDALFFESTAPPRPRLPGLVRPSCPTFPRIRRAQRPGPTTRHGAWSVGAALLARACCRVVPSGTCAGPGRCAPRGSRAMGPRSSPPACGASRTAVRTRSGSVSLTVGSEPRAVPHRRRGSTGERYPSAASAGRRPRPPASPGTHGRAAVYGVRESRGTASGER